MIDTIISILDAAAKSALPTHTRIGLAEQRTTESGPRPTYYVGGSDARHILEDSKGSVSYWRLLAPWRQQDADENLLSVCSGALKRTYQLRHVVFLDRSDEVCSGLMDAIGSAGSALTSRDSEIEGALSLLRVVIIPSSSEPDTIRAAAQEMPGANIPFNKAIAYIDLTVEISGEPECFDECGDTPYDPCADCPDSGECLDATVQNSDVSFTHDIASGATYTLPDVTNIDSDGSPVVTPAQTPFVATPCGAQTSSRRRALIFGLR